jgi:E3 ubiquitin-protein ligase MYCBP2
VNRLRCNCGQNFCIQCKAVPYHFGMTCEQVAAHAAAVRCRFCDTKLDGPPAAAATARPPGKGLQRIPVCNADECKERATAVCRRKLDCGHACCGIRAEEGKGCLPCLNPDCVPSNAAHGTADDFCNICFTEVLSAAPCIRLQCGHIFHDHCVRVSAVPSWC